MNHKKELLWSLWVVAPLHAVDPKILNPNSTLALKSPKPPNYNDALNIPKP